MIEYTKLFVEFCFGLSMFVNAILFVPQIFRLFKTKNPVGLSLTTFVGFNTIQIFSILHGYIHKGLYFYVWNVIKFAIVWLHFFFDYSVQI
jgi:MtN3 and saliva related transmembrane protein